MAGMAGGALINELSNLIVLQVSTAVWITGADQLTCSVVLVAGASIVIKPCDGVNANFGADRAKVAAVVVVFAG